MCNYPEQVIKNNGKIFIPRNEDRKSKLVAVIEIIQEEDIFDLYFTKKISYLILQEKYTSYQFIRGKDPMPVKHAKDFSIGDLINITEYTKYSGTFYRDITGRTLTVVITHIEITKHQEYIISFNHIGEIK